MTPNQLAYQQRRRRNSILNIRIRAAYRQAMQAGQVLTLLGRTSGTNHNNGNCHTVQLTRELTNQGLINDGDEVVYIRGAHLRLGTEGWQWMIGKLTSVCHGRD